MKLFHWRSDALAQCGWGHIIVMAEDVETARFKALAEFKKWLHDPDSALNHKVYDEEDWDADDRQEFKNFMDVFERDICKECIDNDGAIFIMGSS